MSNERPEPTRPGRSTFQGQTLQGVAVTPSDVAAALAGAVIAAAALAYAHHRWGWAPDT